MTSLDTQTAVRKTGAETANTRTRLRWYVAVVAGAIVSLPLGWLLSYGAALMALLGLFFFALFGLLIGAVMYRVAAPARPITSIHIKTGVAVVVLFCWGLAMAKEVHDFPGDKANYALEKVAPLPDGITPDAFRADVRRFVRRTLTEQYGGSGVLGYTRWVLSSSRMEYTVETMTRPIVLRAVQHRWWWAVRVVLSIFLLGFGINSVVGPLVRETDALTDPDSSASE